MVTFVWKWKWEIDCTFPLSPHCFLTEFFHEFSELLMLLKWEKWENKEFIQEAFFSKEFLAKGGQGEENGRKLTWRLKITIIMMIGNLRNSLRRSRVISVKMERKTRNIVIGSSGVLGNNYSREN